MIVHTESANLEIWWLKVAFQVWDGTPHQISATLHSQGGKLQVDSGVPIEKSWSGRSGNNVSSSMSSRRREVWVGGGGPHGDPTNNIFPTPFTGCLLDFKLDGMEVPWDDAVETSNLVPCATEEEEEEFYENLLDENMDGFDEDKYLERLDRIGQ